MILVSLEYWEVVLDISYIKIPSFNFRSSSAIVDLTLDKTDFSEVAVRKLLVLVGVYNDIIS